MTREKRPITPTDEIRARRAEQEHAAEVQEKEKARQRLLKDALVAEVFDNQKGRELLAAWDFDINGKPLPPDAPDGALRAFIGQRNFVLAIHAAISRYHEHAVKRNE